MWASAPDSTMPRSRLPWSRPRLPLHRFLDESQVMNLRWTFFAVAVVAVAVTSILSANAWWAAAVALGTSLAVAAGAIKAILDRRGAPFCIGFAVASASFWFVMPEVLVGDFVRHTAIVYSVGGAENKIVTCWLAMVCGVVGGMIAQRATPAPTPWLTIMLEGLFALTLFAAVLASAWKMATDRVREELAPTYVPPYQIEAH